jgi:mannose-6-phosphate isomerase class I
VIYAGLRPGVDPQQLRAACGDGSVGGLLHEVRPRVGDCFFIPAGTVHALGGGLVVAEIQQSSDTTFRLFDWNRVDAAGRGRELHVDQAIAVTDFSRGPVEPQQPHPDADGLETLVRCDKFILRRAVLRSTLPSSSIGATHQPEPIGATQPIGATHESIGATHEPHLGVARSPGESPFADRVSLGGDGRLRIVAIVSGAARLIAVDGSISALPLGQSFLLPASSPVVRLVTDPSGSGETSAVVLVAELNDINSVISLTG